MKKLTSILFVVTFLFLSFGCGGGGGGSSSSIDLKTSTVRNYQTGDNWQFSISGDDTGTFTITVLSSLVTSPITNDDCYEFYMSGSFSTLGVISNSTFYLQDLDGSEYNFGDWNPVDGYNWIASGTGYVLSTTSPVAVGQSNNGSMTYQDGTVKTFSYTVTGIENVVTGMGTIEAYKATHSSTINWGGGSTANSNSTLWFVPGLSMNVKEDTTITYYQNGTPTGTLHLISTLESTNVVY